MYTTPRTLDPGKVQAQAAFDVIGVNYNVKYPQQLYVNGNLVGHPFTAQTTLSGALPMAPSEGARVGVSNGFDVGFRLQNLDSLAADFKIRLLKGRIDVALDPGIQTFSEFENCNFAFQCGETWGVYYLSAPLLLGINFSQSVSLVLSPGFVYAVTSPAGVVNVNSSGSDTAIELAGQASGPMGRLGVGFDFRITRLLAIHPEVTFLQEYGGDNLLLWVAGIGFNIGAQPDYSDLAQRAPPSAAQQAP
jgi:hypothetical protein